MPLQSWICKGCTNICHMMIDDEVSTYCRTIYDQPDNKGKKWEGDFIRCLDYTTDPAAEDVQIRMWMPPLYEHKVIE